MVEMVNFVKNNKNLTKQSCSMVAGGVLARAIIMEAPCCKGIFDGRDVAMVGEEIIMVQKYFVAILFFCYVESGMFSYTEQCNVTVLQLNWCDAIPVNTQPWLVGI